MTEKETNTKTDQDTNATKKEMLPKNKIRLPKTLT
jgi:hypothetical protein